MRTLTEKEVEQLERQGIEILPLLKLRIPMNVFEKKVKDNTFREKFIINGMKNNCVIAYRHSDNVSYSMYSLEELYNMGVLEK